MITFFCRVLDLEKAEIVQLRIAKKKKIFKSQYPALWVQTQARLSQFLQADGHIHSENCLHQRQLQEKPDAALLHTGGKQLKVP